MLVARRALEPLLDDLAAAADACAVLAEQHRDTPAVGRTLLQQALPLTFGLKAAGWLVGLDESRAMLAAVREYGLALQLGGAVGTLASLGDEGLAVTTEVSRRLGARGAHAAVAHDARAARASSPPRSAPARG